MASSSSHCRPPCVVAYCHWIHAHPRHFFAASKHGHYIRHDAFKRLFSILLKTVILFCASILIRRRDVATSNHSYSHGALQLLGPDSFSMVSFTKAGDSCFSLFFVLIRQHDVFTSSNNNAIAQLVILFHGRGINLDSPPTRLSRDQRRTHNATKDNDGSHSKSTEWNGRSTASRSTLIRFMQPAEAFEHYIHARLSY